MAPLIGLGGTVVGLVSGYLLTGRRDTKEAAREHDRWLRNERMTAYTELLRTATVIVPSTGAPGQPGSERAALYQEAVIALNRAYAHARIAGPKPMELATSKLYAAAHAGAGAYIRGTKEQRAATDERTSRAEKEFIEQAQSVLGVSIHK